MTMCQSCVTALLISSLIDYGPKTKEIIFDEGYIGYGDVEKKEFYNNRSVIFLESDRDTIIAGTLMYDKNNQANVKGKWNIEPGILFKGTFSISNTPEKRLSAKKNSGKLQIAVVNIDEYKTNSLHLKKLSHGNYNITCMAVPGNSIEQIEAEIAEGHIKKHGYSSALPLLSCAKNFRVQLKDNSIFYGRLSLQGNSDNDFSVQFKDGKWYLPDKIIKDIVVSKPSAITGLTSITTTLKESHINKVEFNLPNDKLNNNITQLFVQSNEGKLTYTSTDIFDGTYNIQTTRDGNINIIPLKGTYTLGSGQQLADNWIDQSDLTDKEKEYVKKHYTPTSQFETATALINERYYNAHYAAAEYALNKKDYKTARNYFEEAGKYKNAKEMKRKVEELSALIKDEEKKQKFINKYGTYWGALVYSKEFTLGMTREMCVDIVEDLSVYNINKSEDSWSGTTETWRINYDSIGMATMLFDDLGLIASSYYLKKYPKYMRFRNGKLTEITYNEN